MSIFDNKQRLLGFLPLPHKLFSNTLVSKLILTLMPSLIILLAVTGFLTYRLSADHIAIALQRNVKVQNLGQVQAIEDYLESCKRALLFVAQGRADAASLRVFLEREVMVNKRSHCFLGFISLSDEGHVLLVQQEGKILELPPREIGDCEPDPLEIYNKIESLKKDTAWISGIREVSYPFPSLQNTNNRLNAHAILLAAPVFDGEHMRGYLVMSINAKDIRNILSLYNSEQSPLWAYARSPEVRYSFLFNLEGWVLFQSDNPKHPSSELATYLIRSDCPGTIGLPDLDSAFRPGAKCQKFWKIVAEVKEGKQGLLPVTEYYPGDFFSKEHSMAYAPIMFQPGLEGASVPYAGVAFEDRSRLTLVAGYKHVDVMFIITLAAGLLATLLIYLLSRFVTRPLYRLTEAVKDIQTTGRLDPISIHNASYETASLQDAINKMLRTIRQQLEEIHIRDLRIRSENMREAIETDEGYLQLAESLGPSTIPEIIGFGPRMDTLREEILKASKVDVDVLIVGETGTGKQLTAEAIHQYSHRRVKPLISINCGELDENLLMDTLFGHVKGAFTEAKNDRKGAFLEADGGTLFLDEIQVASPRVQQSLLRAIALRKIKPLGSDKDLDVDVRVIAATNIDLRHLIQAKLFREDLYFRLKVITIHTPPLREHKENILLLALHYLKEGEQITGKIDLKLSRGALERMKLYSWPGNIRELRNCVTRAAVMSENEVIQADELLLDHDGTHPSDVVVETEVQKMSAFSLPPQNDAPLGAAPSRNNKEGGQKQNRQEAPQRAQENAYVRKDNEERKSAIETNARRTSPVGLNSRQQDAWPRILELQSITRNEYEELLGGEISSRTAIYDLQDMVTKGLLKKKGHGPATRYIVIVNN